MLGNAGYHRLVGIYSGRTSRESDLGFVWKAELIREILSQPIAANVASG